MIADTNFGKICIQILGPDRLGVMNHQTCTFSEILNELAMKSNSLIRAQGYKKPEKNVCVSIEQINCKVIFSFHIKNI